MIHEYGTDGTATVTGSAPLSRGPQPGWMTLDQARERAFTGEIVFETEPEVRTYLDNGVAYYAERAPSAPLGERLVEAGVLDQGQLERGTVRIGEVEHLGRLFDRDPSVDRDAVLVVTEALTDELVTELANDVITTIRSTAYRHHPSGLHRWFASPVDSASDYRPGMVSSLETSVLDDLPGLPMFGGNQATDQLYIEWDEPGIDDVPVNQESFVEQFDDSMLEALLDDSAADETAWDAEPELTIDFHSATWPLAQLTLPDGGLISHEDLLSDDDDVEFDVVWPDGRSAVPEVEVEHEAAAAVVPTSVDDLTMTPIATFDEEIVAEVPADVADAVKRAIAALEAASFPAPTVAPIPQPSDFDEPAAFPATAPAPAFNGFAPPSLDTSAEAIYARMAAEQEAVEGKSDSTEPRLPTTASIAEAAADVSVDEDHTAEPEEAGNERSSALRRLIGSLRRKDR